MFYYHRHTWAHYTYVTVDTVLRRPVHIQALGFTFSVRQLVTLTPMKRDVLDKTAQVKYSAISSYACVEVKRNSVSMDTP